MEKYRESLELSHQQKLQKLRDREKYMLDIQKEKLHVYKFIQSYWNNPLTTIDNEYKKTQRFSS